MKEEKETNKQLVSRWKNSIYSVSDLEQKLIKEKEKNKKLEKKYKEEIKEKLKYKIDFNNSIHKNKIKEQLKELDDMKVDGEVFTTAVNFAKKILQELLEERN